MDSFYWYVTEFEGQGGGVREICMLEMDSFYWCVTEFEGHGGGS